MHKNMESVKVYPIHTIQFWKNYAIQMRPYLLFISGIAGLSGMLMSKGSVQLGWDSVIIFIPFFTGYGFGQALTDCFQTDTDKLSSPYRPLSKGIISVRSTLIISVTGLLLSGIIFYLFSITGFFLSMLIVFGLATYSYIKKHFWFAGPFYNSWIVALLPVIGFFSLTSEDFKEYITDNSFFILVTFFSYTSFVLIGYLKDIDADRATNYKTFPVVFGWEKTVIAGDCIALLTLLFFWISFNFDLTPLIAGLAGSIVIIYGQIAAHNIKEQTIEEALIPILSTVRSFVLFHIAIILQFHSYLWPYALLYYGLFEWALYKRPSKYQV